MEEHVQRALQPSSPLFFTPNPARCSGPFARKTPSFEGGMKYRGLEYRVVQGFGRQIWRWWVYFDASHEMSGESAIKSAAMLAAERAIDRELASKKLKLVSLQEQN